MTTYSSRSRGFVSVVVLVALAAGLALSGYAAYTVVEENTVGSARASSSSMEVKSHSLLDIFSNENKEENAKVQLETQGQADVNTQVDSQATSSLNTDTEVQAEMNSRLDL
jgi:hypothetical protein